MKTQLTRRSMLAGLSSAAWAALPGMSWAQTDRPIKFILPNATGSGVDAITRAAAPALGKALGANVVVENQAGASGVIGLQALAKNPPDGFTLSVVSNNVVIFPSVLKSLPFVMPGDFTPIAIVGSTPMVLVVNPQKVTATNSREFIAQLKAKPDGYNFGSGGNGTILHLAAEMLEKSSGTEMIMVHYKGSGGALADLIGGQINMSFGTAPGLMQHIRNGKVIPIAVSSAQRMAALPNTPSVAELLPGYDINNWFGLFAPPKTPKPVVDRIYQAINKALSNPELSKKFGDEGFDIVGVPPDRFEKSFKQEILYWQKFAKDNNLKIE